jgi:hypothetical protein
MRWLEIERCKQQSVRNVKRNSALPHRAETRVKQPGPLFA